MKWFARLLLFGCWLMNAGLQAQPLSRQPVVTLADGQDRIMLRGLLSSYKDSSGKATIQAVAGRATAFVPVPSPVPNFGVIAGTQIAKPVWLRFRVENPDNHPQSWLAEINFWCFDELQLFVTTEAGQLLYESPVMGWKIPSLNRTRQHRNYWFPFTVPANQRVVAYLRVLKHRGTQIVPIELIRGSAYEFVAQKSYFFWGGVLFTLLFVGLMSLIFYLNTFNQIYIRYVFCLLGLVGFFVINNGFLNQFAFDVQFWMPRQNVYFLFPLALFYSQLVFVRTFLPMRTLSERIDQIGKIVLWAGVVCLFSLTAEWFVPLTPLVERVLIVLFTSLYWLPLPVIIAYIVTSIVRRQKAWEAWLYLIAIVPFYSLNFGQVFANFGLVPTYEPLVNFTYYALAALFEVLVLTVGMAYRYKLERDRAEQMTKEHARQQQRTYEAEVQTLALKNGLLIEKERIARDLHDNVGAHLAFIVTNLTHITGRVEKQPGTDNQGWAEQLRTIVGHTREAVKLLRETIWAIHQETFTVEEFDERLRQYINRYVHEVNGLSVEVDVEGALRQRLSSMQVLNLFRIVQEALTNVQKHAQATTAHVLLHIHTDGHMHLRIHDNGCGFTPPNVRDFESHYGLNNMKIRAEELGGTFRIQGEAGTTVDVEV